MRAALALAFAATSCGDAPVATSDALPDAGDLDPALPCDVRDVIARRCVHCHAAPPAAGAPVALRSRLDFLAPSSVDGEDLARRALTRLRDLGRPMPPASEPPLRDPERATLEAWLTAGAPSGPCDPLPAAPHATTCASGSAWARGDDGDRDMNPGLACRACHEAEASHVAVFFAGTVMAGFHERHLCNSPPPAEARIEILDMSGAVTLTLTPTASGNFHSSSLTAGVPVPYRARLVVGSRVREMREAQRTGDCNLCHTEQGGTITPGGVSTPGRLVWPD